MSFAQAGVKAEFLIRTCTPRRDELEIPSIKHLALSRVEHTITKLPGHIGVYLAEYLAPTMVPLPLCDWALLLMPLCVCSCRSVACSWMSFCEVHCPLVCVS